MGTAISGVSGGILASKWKQQVIYQQPKVNPGVDRHAGTTWWAVRNLSVISGRITPSNEATTSRVSLRSDSSLVSGSADGYMPPSSRNHGSIAALLSEININCTWYTAQTVRHGACM